MRIATLAKPLAIVAGLVALGLALRGLGLQDRVQDAAEAGPAAFVAMAALGCALGVPRQVAAYAAGYAYGFWPGLAASLAAMVLGCAADFAWARLLARDWVASRLRGRLLRVDRLLSARPFAATLTLRLLPVGSNLLLNLAAGVSGIRAATFLAASAIGYVPMAAVGALLGAGTGPGQAGQLAIGGVLLASSLLLGWNLVRKQGEAARGRDQGEAHPGAEPAGLVQGREVGRVP